jgi:hypothetical protein
MKAKTPAASSFFQLLAHRERGRTRLLAWSVGETTSPTKPRWIWFKEAAPTKPVAAPLGAGRNQH